MGIDLADQISTERGGLDLYSFYSYDRRKGIARMS